MKKLISSLVMSAMIFAGTSMMVGCGGDGKTTTAKGSTSTTKADKDKTTTTETKTGEKDTK